MKWFTILVLAFAIGLATAASPFASSSPDGLERVAGDNGFAPRADHRDAPLFGSGTDSRVATGLAGFAGTLLVFAFGAGVARVVVER